MVDGAGAAVVVGAGAAVVVGAGAGADEEWGGFIPGQSPRAIQGVSRFTKRHSLSTGLP